MNKLTLKSMALAAITGTLAGASGTVLADAEAEALARLKKPESSFSVGFGYLTSDAPLAGQYTGKDDSGFYLLGEVDLVRLDGETGTWLSYAAATSVYRAARSVSNTSARATGATLSNSTRFRATSPIR